MITGINIQGMNVWHQRFIHINIKYLKSIDKQSGDLTVRKVNFQVCYPGQLERAKRKTFDSMFKKTSYLDEIVQSDLSTHLPKSMNGAKYFITLKDQHTTFTHVV